MSHSKKHHHAHDRAPQPNGHAAPEAAAAGLRLCRDRVAGERLGGGDDALREELNAMRDRHLRTAAEFDNYRKRVERERADSYVRAQAQLAEKLLEALDDLQRIADFDPVTTTSTALHEGAEMVERKFLRALEAAGLEPVEAEGKPFDPTVHEAITTAPTDVEEEDDTVADVFQKGYRFKGVLLRPARVRVKKYG
jgi:molecular chaperone GrpE